MLLALTVGIILGLLISPVFASESETKMLGQKYEQYIRARPATTTTTMTQPRSKVGVKPTSPDQAKVSVATTPIITGDWVSQCKIWMQGIIPEEQHADALFIFQRESKCNYLAKNPHSSATGICQTLIKTHAVEADFLTNPLTQMRWCHQYAIGRYGSWANAKKFWLSNHWW